MLVTTEHDGVPILGASLSAEYYVRHLAFALAARAMWKLHQGKYTASAEDLRACGRLALLVGQNPTAIAGGYEAAITSVVFEGTIQWIQRVATKQPDLLHIVAKRTQTSSYSAAERIDLDGRSLLLDICQHLKLHGMEQLERLDGGAPVTSPGINELRRLDGKLDWDLIVLRVNQFMDRVVDAAGDSDEARRELLKIEADLRKRSLRLESLAATTSRAHSTNNQSNGKSPAEDVSESIAEILIVTLCPDFNGPINRARRTRLRRELIPVAVALERFRLAHGHYPKNPQELVPEFIEVLPTDPFAGGPLIYRKTDDGFALYSMGQDLEDDGGPKGGFVSEDGTDVGIVIPMRLTTEN